MTGLSKTSGKISSGMGAGRCKQRLYETINRLFASLRLASRAVLDTRVSQKSRTHGNPGNQKKRTASKPKLG